MALVLKFAPISNFTVGKFSWYLWYLQKSTRVDQIDSFTTELVEKKEAKWNRARESFLNQIPLPKQHVYQRLNHVAKSLSRDFEAIRKPELCIDIRLMSQSQLDNILSGILDDEDYQDFNFVIKQCITFCMLPSPEVLTRCLEHLVSIPHLQTIEALSEVCEKADENFFKDNSNFFPYKSLALWRSGNVDQALFLIIEGYQLSNHNRHVLREAFRTMANETIGTKSEAVLVTLRGTAERVYEEYQDTFLVACVWKNMFTSEWFSDQQMSEELFEKYEKIRETAYRRSSSICYNLLSQHDTDSVHRLIQLFLKFGNKDACAKCLRMLFNYQYWRRDLRACSEIMQYCLDIDLALPEVETQKLLNLLLNRSSVIAVPIPKSQCSKFQYKF